MHPCWRRCLGLLVVVVLGHAATEPPPPPGVAVPAEHLDLVAGEYTGTIVTHQDVPGRTFIMVVDGQLVGDYIISDPQGDVIGRLDQFRWIADRQYRCRWQHGHLQGTLVLWFPPAYQSFYGYWGNGAANPSHEFSWTGAEAAAP